MSYIEPNTDIYLLEGVPLDPNYENTIAFPLIKNGQATPFVQSEYQNITLNEIIASREAQAQHFLNVQNYNHYTFHRQSYQRVNNGVMRLHKNAENLMRVNYLMFKNTNFQDIGESALNSRWFYAFVDKVDYINNEVCEISYTIDIMQTWWFDYIPNPSFVEREHTVTDELFSNIIEENIECGDEYVNNSHSTFDMNEQIVLILTNRTVAGGSPATSVCANNIYTPVRLVGTLYPTAIPAIDALLDNYNENDIITIFQCPKFCLPELPPPGSIIEPVTRALNITPNLNTIDGYTPKNKKLFCYPYNCLSVSNNCGQTEIYRWEDWSGQIGNFEVKGVALTTPSVTCYPINYRGMAQDYDASITYSDFPVCAWGGNTFKTWWSENKNSFATNAISGIAQSLLSYKYMPFSNVWNVGSTPATIPIARWGNGNSIDLYTKLPNLRSDANISAMAGAHAFGQIAQSVAMINDIKNSPSKTHGQVKFDSLNSGNNRLRFDFYNISIKAQYARIIDDYFTRYGYACKRVKEPNRMVRTRWTYVKTAGCTLGSAKLPADDEKKICSIYDNGVTFWMFNHISEIGNFKLDNSVISGG